ncbi:MAG: protein kinase [Candidatus Eremiobacterota bacterium]
MSICAVGNRCPNCKTENSDTAKFCCDCGKFLMVPRSEARTEPLSEGNMLIGRYTIKNLIKSGGMAAIYRAEDNHLGKICAVKELLPHWSKSKQEKEYMILRFKSEAKILSELHHESLPRVSDYFTYNEQYYLVMDFIDGEDLDAVLLKKGKSGLPYEQVIQLGVQICNILEYLHTCNPPVIYRDLKPGNIMIRASDGKLFLIDFGIAYAIEQNGSPRTMIGTMGYIAPEQYMGKPVIESDLYSLGATLYHLFTGLMPVPFTYRSIRESVPSIPAYLDSVISRSLELEAGKRFHTAREMKMALLDKGNGQENISNLLLENEKLRHDLRKSRLTYEENKVLRKELDKSQEKYRILEDKINEFIKHNPFPGSFSSYSPLRLLRFVLSAHLTGSISYNSEKIKGKVTVKNEKIVNVTCNGWEGELALIKFLRMSDGTFDFYPYDDENIKLSAVPMDLIEDFAENRLDNLLFLDDIVTSMSPDMIITVNTAFLRGEKDIKLTKYHMKIMSMISRGTNTINNLCSSLNSSQLKVSEAIYYMVKSGFLHMN